LLVSPRPRCTHPFPSRTSFRAAAVAATSPLAGEARSRVLGHGRKALHAKGIVGIVASEGCALEILPKIDFPEEDTEAAKGRIRQRLVHMLAVALDMRIDVGQITGLGYQNETFLEILVRIFLAKLGDELRRGMPRQYIAHQEDLVALRGRLDATRQFTLLAANPSRLASHFDALSADIALNQIMKATVDRLSRLTQSTSNQRRLRELSFFYADVAVVPVLELRWDAVLLDRTNSRWRDLLSFARLFLGERYQTTSAGLSRGFSLLFEMHSLFEEYVAKLISRALVGSDLRAVSQGGRLYCLETPTGGVFQTKPDILIKKGGDTVQVIDTKWKRISSRLEDKKRGVSQADIYQMMAYGHLYDAPRLTLLYPHHLELHEDEGLLSSYRVNGLARQIETATIDLAVAGGTVERLRRVVDLSLN